MPQQELPSCAHRRGKSRQPLQSSLCRISVSSVRARKDAGDKLQPACLFGSEVPCIESSPAGRSGEGLPCPESSWREVSREVKTASRCKSCSYQKMTWWKREDLEDSIIRRGVTLWEALGNKWVLHTAVRPSDVTLMVAAEELTAESIAPPFIHKGSILDTTPKYCLKNLSTNLIDTSRKNLSTVDKFFLRPVFSYIHFLEVFFHFFNTS